LATSFLGEAKIPTVPPSAAEISTISNNIPKNNLANNVIVNKIKFKYRSFLEMNNGKALTLDVLIIYDNSLFSIVNGLTAQKYFETRGQLYKNNKHLMSICSWDVLPGKVSPNYNLHIGPNASAIVIFAGYENSDNNHKLIIPIDTNNLMVLLNEKTLISPDNGIDYINIGNNKKFIVMETIKKSEPVTDNYVPSGYNVFYSLDSKSNPIPILENNNFNFKDNKIKKSNEPIRLETLNFSTNDFDIVEKDFFVPVYNSWGRLLIDKVKNKLFSKEGIIDNNILNIHGVAILYNYYDNKKNYDVTVGFFKKNKFLYMGLLDDFYKNVEYGRQSILEDKRINVDASKINGSLNSTGKNGKSTKDGNAIGGKNDGSNKADGNNSKGDNDNGDEKNNPDNDKTNEDPSKDNPEEKNPNEENQENAEKDDKSENPNDEKKDLNDPNLKQKDGSMKSDKEKKNEEKKNEEKKNEESKKDSDENDSNKKSKNSPNYNDNPKLGMSGFKLGMMGSLKQMAWNALLNMVKKGAAKAARKAVSYV
jgi:hypothetical protein